MVSNYFAIEMHLKIRKKGVVSGQQLFYYSNAFEMKKGIIRNALKMRNKGIVSGQQLFYYRNAFENQEERDC